MSDIVSYFTELFAHFHLSIILGEGHRDAFCLTQTLSQYYLISHNVNMSLAMTCYTWVLHCIF